MYILLYANVISCSKEIIYTYIHTSIRLQPLCIFKDVEGVPIIASFKEE